MFATHAVPRADVGRYFADAKLDSAGFESTVDISDLDGTYTFGLAMREADGVVRRCSKWGNSISIDRVVAPAIEGR
jgi:hypothetical protein